MEICTVIVTKMMKLVLREEAGQAAFRRLLNRCIVTVIKMMKLAEKEERGQAVLRILFVE